MLPYLSNLYTLQKFHEIFNESFSESFLKIFMQAKFHEILRH